MEGRIPKTFSMVSCAKEPVVEDNLVPNYDLRIAASVTYKRQTSALTAGKKSLMTVKNGGVE